MMRAQYNEEVLKIFAYDLLKVHLKKPTFGLDLFIDTYIYVHVGVEQIQSF